MAAERFERVGGRENLTEWEKPTARRRRSFVVRCQTCQNTSGFKKKLDSVIRSPRFGDEELGLRTPHQRWSHGAEKSEVQEAFNVSR